MRIDKWLWVARFFKSRSGAKAAVMNGRIHVNGARIKPAKEIAIGDLVSIKDENIRREFIVKAVRSQRGPAKIAQTLYLETKESIARTNEETSSRKGNYDTGLRPHTKPTKSDRRILARLKRTGGR